MGELLSKLQYILIKLSLHYLNNARQFTSSFTMCKLHADFYVHADQNCIRNDMM